jgi:hypothetical protein
MTTGRTCGTPGCAGIAPEPDGRCQRCRIEAMPPGPARTLRQIIHTALNGQETRGDALTAGRNDREAGS